MRYLVVHDGLTIGEVDLREGHPGSQTMVGALEPTAAYEKVQPVCRRPVDALVTASGGIAALEADGPGEPSREAVAAFTAALGEVMALGLQLRELGGAPVPTVGPVNMQDYTGLATELRARPVDGSIMVGVTLAVLRGGRPQRDV